jgi:hypothetical protein
MHASRRGAASSRHRKSLRHESQGSPHRHPCGKSRKGQPPPSEIPAAGPRQRTTRVAGKPASPIPRSRERGTSHHPALRAKRHQAAIAHSRPMRGGSQNPRRRGVEAAGRLSLASWALFLDCSSLHPEIHPYESIVPQAIWEITRRLDCSSLFHPRRENSPSPRAAIV